jgi:hypothetical protein
MSTGGDDVRDVAKEVLSELLPALQQALATAAPNGNGHPHTAAVQVTEGDPVVPQVPAPPVAKVHRPSGWREPAAAQETAESLPSAQSDDGAIERVELRSDADLEAFVQALALRLENPRERAAILSGDVRFQLAGAAVPNTSSTTTIRIESGAVTERAVRDAARAGARLVLSPRAVLTPMARDRARSLGVEIEKEKRC